MCFVSSVIGSCFWVCLFSIVGLIDLYENDRIERNDLFYEVLPSIFLLSKNSYIITSYLVIFLTGFFLLPVSGLWLIQIKNFYFNRTTNERYRK